MGHVLIMVVVFSSATGVATDSRSFEFDTEQACETARAGLVSGVDELKGTLGREVFVACYAKQ
tara:strand:- start:1028 stop:1216 length:189 start_codon:yes stop_codon:yes gene_type:complete